MLSNKEFQTKSTEGYQALDRPWSQKAQSAPAVDAHYKDKRGDSADRYLSPTTDQNPPQMQGLTPMQRWSQETVKEQPWNGIAAFAMHDIRKRKEGHKRC